MVLLHIFSSYICISSVKNKIINHCLLVTTGGIAVVTLTNITQYFFAIVTIVLFLTHLIVITATFIVRTITFIIV